MLFLGSFSALNAKEAELIKVDKNGIISQSCYKIDNIYPSKIVGAQGLIYPGNRGVNQLVIYERNFGKHTGTNEYGREAIVKNGTVTQIAGANSTIPSDGFVISGHGTAKKWMSDNIKVGTHVKINPDNMQIIVFTDVESYRYFALEKIKEVEKIVKSSSNKNLSENQKLIKKYLKYAKKNYKKARKNTSKGLSFAMKSLEYSDMALIYSLPYDKNELKGVWLRPVDKTRSEIVKTLDELQNAGINTVFLETFFHGKTIFPSDTMKKYGFVAQNPDFEGIDFLAVWLEEARKRNIKTHIWFESFYIGNKAIVKGDKTILDVKPDWCNLNKPNAESLTPIYHEAEHKGYFLDPANDEVITFLKELLTEISAKYGIDGINLDYVRYPQSTKPKNLRYENSNWGYTKPARKAFKNIYSIDPVDIAYGTNMWENWDKYRQNQITYYVRDISKMVKNRNIVLSAVVFPSEENSLETKQQNWDEWVQNCYLDAITPLILTADYELSSAMLKNIKKKVNTKSQIYPGLFVTFMQGECEDLLKQLHTIRAEKLDGVVLFDWAHYDEKYKNLLKSSMFKNIK